MLHFIDEENQDYYRIREIENTQKGKGSGVENLGSSLSTTT